MVMTQAQPPAIMAIMPSPQQWIILHMAASPLVHATHIPLAVISHLTMPIIMLTDIIIMPFIIMWQPSMFPFIIMQRFCIMRRAMSSSHVHVIFMPLGIFSIFMAQRGIIIMFMAAPVPIGTFIPEAFIIGIAMRSIVIIGCIFIFSMPAASAGRAVRPIVFKGKPHGHLLMRPHPRCRRRANQNLFNIMTHNAILQSRAAK